MKNVSLKRYDLVEVSKLLSLSVRSIERRIEKGLIKAYKDGRKWYVPEKALFDYINSKESIIT